MAQRAQRFQPQLTIWRAPVQGDLAKGVAAFLQVGQPAVLCYRRVMRGILRQREGRWAAPALICLSPFHFSQQDAYGLPSEFMEVKGPKPKK